MEQSAISEPLEIGMLDFPPYYILGKNEEVKGGLLVDMLVKIFDRAGIEYTLAGYPPKRLYSNVVGITHVWLERLVLASMKERRL